VVALLNKKNVGGHELKVTVAKAPHERTSYIERIARLKKIEKFSSAWPPSRYLHIAQKDASSNTGFRLPHKRGRAVVVKPSKTIAKKKAVKSTALYLSNVPKTVPKKDILAALKAHGVTKGKFGQNGKRTSYGFAFFKTAEDRAKAHAALKEKGLQLGEHKVGVKSSSKYSHQIVHEKRPKKAAKKPVAAAPAK